MRAFWIASMVAGLGEATVFLFLAWPRVLHLRPPPVLQVTEITTAGTRIYLPDRVLLGELGSYHDPLFAFLMFDHYRSTPELKGLPLLLHSNRVEGKGGYSIWVQLPNDLIRGTYILGALHDDHLASEVRYQWVSKREWEADQEDTAMLEQAYSNPVPHALEQLSDEELEVYLGSFIRFKSLTDYRIEHATDPNLNALSEVKALQFAGDMIAVAHFYDVPLSLMLGIGAMENNYMNAPGDLTHTVWKRRAQRGDVVLERRRHRVLVKDDSIGVWQITRKTLRRAHELYEHDTRDYGELPEWLQPPKRLNMDDVDPPVLTTYAGLLLRNLLDHCNDDVMQAAGSYNGTLRYPNLQYAEGVQLVAEYARRIVGNAATVTPLRWKVVLAAPANVMPQNASLPISLTAAPTLVCR